MYNLSLDHATVPFDGYLPCTRAMVVFKVRIVEATTSRELQAFSMSFSRIASIAPSRALRTSANRMKDKIEDALERSFIYKRKRRGSD